MRHCRTRSSRATHSSKPCGVAASDIESNTLDAFMRLLRAKVEAPGEPKLLHTVRGVGFSCGLTANEDAIHPRALDAVVFRRALVRAGFFSVEIYSRLQNELLKDVDQRLVAEARGVKAVFEIEGITEATLAEEMGEFVKEVPQGELLQLATDAGTLLWPQGTHAGFSRIAHVHYRRTDCGLRTLSHLRDNVRIARADGIPSWPANRSKTFAA